MPRIEAYARLAPFTIDELVDAANGILRDRPRLHIAKRTVRYYIAESILPPPGGSPKFARYGLHHLLRLIATRCLVDRGRSLDEVKLQLDDFVRFPEPQSIEAVQALVDGDAGPTTSPLSPLTISLSEQASGAIMPAVEVVRRIPLGDGFTLEAPAHIEIEDARAMATRLLSERSFS